MFLMKGKVSQKYYFKRMMILEDGFTYMEIWRGMFRKKPSDLKKKKNLSFFLFFFSSPSLFLVVDVVCYFVVDLFIFLSSLRLHVSF